MRSLAVVFVLVLALGYAQAYPLQGGNGAASCTLFGAFKTPIPGEEPNATTKECAFYVDVGLIRARNATYELVDDQDKAYHPDQVRSRVLQPGRQLLVFVVPADSLFKLFKVYPSEGSPFAINWWKTPKGIKGDVVLRYYGVVDFRADPDEQSIAMEVTLNNQGNIRVPISPENFTLVDQWGWPYYTLEGFRESYLEPGRTSMVRVNFSSLSPLSRPAMLIYEYPPDNQIVIDLDKDTGPLSDEVVYGNKTPIKESTSAAPDGSALTSAAALNTSPAQSIQNASGQEQASKDWIKSLKDDINATKARLKNMNNLGAGSGDQGSAVGSQIKASVDEARARLELMKKELKNSTQTSKN